MADHEAETRFRELFDAEARQLLGYAMRRTDSPEDAADVVAESFMVAWRRLGEIPQGFEARLWLYGVARRVVANHRRGDLRQTRLCERLARQLDIGAATRAGPEAETAGIVRAALERLSEVDRELLLLTNWEGLSPSELGRAMDIPPSTIRTRLQRAHERLRAELEHGDCWRTDRHDPSRRLEGQTAALSGCETRAESERL